MHRRTSSIKWFTHTAREYRFAKPVKHWIVPYTPLSSTTLNNLNTYHSQNTRKHHPPLKYVAAKVERRRAVRSISSTSIGKKKESQGEKDSKLTMSWPKKGVVSWRMEEKRSDGNGESGWLSRRWNFAGRSTWTRFLLAVARYSIYWSTINDSPRGPSRRDPRSKSNATLFEGDCNNIFGRAKDAHNTTKFKSRAQGHRADFFSSDKTIAARGVAARETGVPSRAFLSAAADSKNRTMRFFIGARNLRRCTGLLRWRTRFRDVFVEKLYYLGLTFLEES